MPGALRAQGLLCLEASCALTRRPLPSLRHARRLDPAGGGERSAQRHIDHVLHADDLVLASGFGTACRVALGAVKNVHVLKGTATLRAALLAAGAARHVDADHRAVSHRQFVTKSTHHGTPREPPVTLGNAD